MKLKPPVGGSKSLSLSLNHSFTRFVQMTDSFRNEESDSLYDSLDLFKNTDSFINKTVLCLLEDEQRLSCDLFGIIFIDETEHKQCS